MILLLLIGVGFAGLSAALLLRAVANPLRGGSAPSAQIGRYGFRGGTKEKPKADRLPHLQVLRTSGSLQREIRDDDELGRATSFVEHGTAGRRERRHAVASEWPGNCCGSGDEQYDRCDWPSDQDPFLHSGPPSTTERQVCLPIRDEREYCLCRGSVQALTPALAIG